MSDDENNETGRGTRSAQGNVNSGRSRRGDSAQANQSDQESQYDAGSVDVGGQDVERLVELIQNEPELATKLISELNKDEQIIAAQLTSSSFSGPLPHPNILKGYGQIDPTFPDRIMRMAEQRQKVEDRNLSKLVSSESFAVSFATVATCTLPWIVFVIALVLHEDLGAWIGGIGGIILAIASLVKQIRSHDSNDETQNQDPNAIDRDVE